MMYDPATDPAVINGIQEAYGFRRGDTVKHTNPYGMTFGPHTVIGFVQEPGATSLPENTVYIDSDSPWYPVKPSSLRKICGGQNQRENEQVYYSIEDGLENQIDKAETESEAISKCIASPNAKEVFAFRVIGEEFELIGCVFRKEEENKDE